MIGTLGNLISAMATFVIGHFVLASLPFRQALIERLGENRFRGLFSVFALVTLTWVIVAYNTAPFVELWAASAAFNIIPLAIMPVACVFAVSGLTTRNVTMVGGENTLSEPDPTPGIMTITRHPFLWALTLWSLSHLAVRNVTMVGGENTLSEPDPTPGIMTITRHPFLWALTLWSLSHLAVTGDTASIVLFGGISILTIGGMAHIDHRRTQAAGAAWGPIALRTSLIPFAAAITGRTKIDWTGIGIARLAGGGVLYGIFIGLHEFAFGVTPLPG